MRQMTDKEVTRNWEGLQKRQRIEEANAVARFCVGHSIKEVAEHLGYSVDWINTQLDVSGISVAHDGSKVLASTGSTNNAAQEASRIVEDYKPEVTVKLKDDGNGGQSVDAVSGKDADEFEEYLDRYLSDGHEPVAAVRLATAEWAGEEAVEACLDERKDK